MKSLLTHPMLGALEMGSPGWFAAQDRMIRAKPLVKRIYDLWYRIHLEAAAGVPGGVDAGAILELGSGSNYVKQIAPAVITSDVVPGTADMQIDARNIPFPDGSVRALLLTHAFHHIPDVERFLEEAQRVLVPGGVISMVECTHTPFARFFFSRIHPEPYDDRTSGWSFPQRDSMLDSNQALSWVVLFRDRRKFLELFPSFEIGRPRFTPWFSYLLSGGVNLRSLVPGFLEGLVARMDAWLTSLDRVFAIHWHLTIRKRA